tara:strand:- start:171 stop:329 length:159 start_codon:yes stop_codon:yes gene_type:complete
VFEKGTKPNRRTSLNEKNISKITSDDENGGYSRNNSNLTAIQNGKSYEPLGE